MSNTAEETTEETSTESTATTEDTSNSTAEVDAVDAGESSSSIESSESTETEGDLYYDFDGEEVSASTVKEWKENGLRQSDYTKKSQANADTRKQLEAKQAEVGEVKIRLSDLITDLESSITDELSSDEMVELREIDFGEYSRRKEDIAEKQAKSEKAKKELAKLKEAEEAEFTANEKSILMESMPEWSDPKKLQADMDLMSAYVDERGFSENDVMSLKSNKLTLMALDAAKYQALQKDTAKTEEAVAKAPNVIKAKVKQSDTSNKTTAAQRRYPNMS